MDEVIVPVAKLTAAPTSPIFEELFCVVCAMMTGGNETFCSKSCENAWINFDTGKWDWAIFAEWSLT